MTQEKIEHIILEVLNEIGIYIDVSSPFLLKDDIESNTDMDLRNYIDDSLMFISFIVELEKKFGIEFPDELLMIDTLASLSGFAYLLVDMINDRKEDHNEQ